MDLCKNHCVSVKNTDGIAFGDAWFVKQSASVQTTIAHFIVIVHFQCVYVCLSQQQTWSLYTVRKGDSTIAIEFRAQMSLWLPSIPTHSENWLIARFIHSHSLFVSFTCRYRLQQLFEFRKNAQIAESIGSMGLIKKPLRQSNSIQYNCFWRGAWKKDEFVQISLNQNKSSSDAIAAAVTVTVFCVCQHWDIRKGSKNGAKAFLELINALNEIYLFMRRFLGYEYIMPLCVCVCVLLKRNLNGQYTLLVIAT